MVAAFPAQGSPDEPSAQAMRFAEDGAERFRNAMSEQEIAALESAADGLLGGRPGARIAEGELARELLGIKSSLGRIAAAVLGTEAKCVRAVLFDKNAATNWAVGWHQDRTIVVRERRDVPGFGPWTVKDGLVQVEPPFAVTAGMINLRAHIDDCDADHAPLLIAPGSHRLGRIPVRDIDDVVSKLGQRTCLASRGDVWLYSTAILHASEVAKNPRRRRVLQVDYSCSALEGGLEWLTLG